MKYIVSEYYFQVKGVLRDDYLISIATDHEWINKKVNISTKGIKILIFQLVTVTWFRSGNCQKIFL